MIEVNSKVKALVEEKAKLVAKTLGKKAEEFNQDMNAYAILAALKHLGVEVKKEHTSDVLMVLKKGGNASALRQAITAETKKVEALVEANEELLDL